MSYKEIKKELARIIKESEKNNSFYINEDNYDETESIYLGSFMDFDPCGKYHCVLVPNEPLKKCERFWDNFYKAAEALGGWIDCGEGDFTDVYFNRIIEKDSTNEADLETGSNY